MNYHENHEVLGQLGYIPTKPRLINVAHGLETDMRPLQREQFPAQPTQAEAEEAVRTLLRWSGADPEALSLLQTPARVVQAYQVLCAGYKMNPYEILQPTYTQDTQDNSSQDIVLLKNIHFESLCEHHMAPFIGTAHIGYLPNHNIVGISKLVLLVECYARRLQLQERLTIEIAQSLQDILQPKGVAVIVQAKHHCMKSYDIHQPHAELISQHFTGCFQEDLRCREELYQLLRN